jgi:hypothetical protein
MKIAVTDSLPRRYESAERQAMPAKTEKSAALATGYTISESIAYGAAIKIIIIGALDLYGGDFTDAQRAAGFDVDRTVNLRRIAFAAALGRAFFHFVNQNGLARAHFPRQTAAGNLALAPH